ncbi:uncharacterized protein LOC101860096 [Aplysia californica]|uniref:Uncharacterized protein LOC101860096 n=1 Tax=Aplysia californica TaxID=6500 RepID=A0ABM0ZZV0_APLCA|nr:uncharacterized protein LOC101860096 [Aplysia californica]
MTDSDIIQQLSAGEADKALELIQLADQEELGKLTDDLGRTVAHHVVQHLMAGSPDAVPTLLKALVDKGFNIAQLDQEGKSAADALGEKAREEGILLPLLKAGEGSALEKLVLSGWRVNLSLSSELMESLPEEARDKVKQLEELQTQISGVHSAVREGRLEDVKELTAKLTSLAEALDPGHLPLLHEAVIFGQPEITAHILETFPLTINAKDHLQRTALHYAASCPDEGRLYQILASAGADDTVKDVLGKSPADYRAEPTQLSLVEVKDKALRLLGSPEKAESRPQSSADRAAEGEKPMAAIEEEPDDNGAEAGGQGGQEAEQAAQQEPEPPKTPPKPATPPGPKVVKPVDVYVSRQPQRQAPPPSTAEGLYIAQHLGTALTLALAEIAEKRPWDPIEYLANWLYNYHDNTDYARKQAEMVQTIRDEEARANEEEVQKFKRHEELRRFQEEEAEKRRQEEEERKKKEQEELQRSAREAALAQKPQLPTVTEDEEAEAEAEDDDPGVRDRDVNGMTEMHKLASQPGIDLKALIELGYSIADRDVTGKTVRDVAVDTDQHDTVEAIDSYMKQLLEDGRTDVLEQLALEGLDDLEELAHDGLPEVTKVFLDRAVGLKDQIAGAFKTAEESEVAELKEALEALPKLAQAKDKGGRSLLHVAVLTGNRETVEYLVTQFPASLTDRDNMNRTPLHYANGVSADLTDLLVSKGASIKSRDAMKRTVQYYKEHSSEIAAIRESLGIKAPAVAAEPVEEQQASLDDPNVSTGDADTTIAADQTLSGSEPNTSVTADTSAAENADTAPEAEPAQVATVVTGDSSEQQ